MTTALQCLPAACIAAALVLSAAAAQAQTAVPPAAKQSAPAKAAPAVTVTHLLHLSVVTLEGSGWTDARVMDAVRGAGRLLGQCGVKLERVEMVGLAVPRSHLATPTALELAQDYGVSRPAVFFLRGTRSVPPHEAQSYTRTANMNRPALADTIWITPRAPHPQVALAHELAHVLMDDPAHSGDPASLMRAAPAPAGTALSAAQCERLRDSGYANGLLKKTKP